MKYVLVFEFPGTGYSSRFYTCSHSGNEVMKLAYKVWEDTGVGTIMPFQQGRGLERKVTEMEIEVLRKLFTHRVEQYYPVNPTDPKFDPTVDSAEEYEAFVKDGNKFDDRAFLELAEIGTRWSTDTCIRMIFDLAKLADPTVQYTNNTIHSRIDLF